MNFQTYWGLNKNEKELARTESDIRWDGESGADGCETLVVRL